MAEVIGSLRDDKATFGEKEVLKRLENGLSDENTVYVECPLNDGPIQRFPDFIVVTNFGVVIVEVKDWVVVLDFDKYHIRIQEKGGRTRQEKNPVLTARDYATVLNNELQKIPALVDEQRGKCHVPWGYTVVFPHLPTSTISRMRQVWGENNVLNLQDVEPYLIQRRSHLPAFNSQPRAGCISDGNQSGHIHQ
jgi:hypothetical protein